MEIALCVMRTRAWRAAEPARQLLDGYIARCAKSQPVTLEEFRDEAALWAWAERRRGRVPAFHMLADSGGRQYTSEQFAGKVAEVRDHGTQFMILAIGPADGWSGEALARANTTVSFGKMTLPHELAAVLAAEQIYRATTIWSGHPYHGRH